MKKNRNYNMTRLILIPFCTLVLISLSSCFSCSSWVKNHIEPMDINAAITGVKNTSPCFVQVALSSKDNLDFCSCRGRDATIDSLRIGDSIIKPWGSSEILIIKKESGERISMNYPCCDG